MRVGEDLHLDVTGPGEVALEVTLGASEIALGLALSAFERGGSFVGCVDDLHPTPATAVGGLYRDGPAELLAKGDHLFRVFEHLVTTRHAGHAHRLGRETRGDFIPHDFHGLGRRSDEGDPARDNGASKVGVLREETVTRMHAVRARALEDVQNCVGVEIAFGDCLTSEGVGLVGQSHVQGVAVQFRIHGHCGDAHFATGPDHANGDLASIGDEDFP